MLAIIVLNVDKKLWLPLELETINSRNTTSRDVAKHVSTKKIVVILFDDKTQFLLRQNGLPIKDFEKKGRGLIKSAIERLEASKVKSIGINLNLSSPSSNAEDGQLAKTVVKFKNIVVADSVYSFSYSSYFNKLLKSTAVGFGELYADYDKIVHKIKLVEKSYKEIPAFSYALYKVSADNDIDNNLKIKNEFYLKYPNSFIEKYSFIDLIQGKINPALLKNKIVILGIGLKSKLLRDQLLNPFEKNTLTSDSEVQAIALANLLDRLYLFKFSLSDYPLLFIFLSIFLGILFSSMPPIRSFITGTAFFIGFVVFSQIVYLYLQTVIELVPFLFLLLGNLVIGSLIFLQLNLQEQNIELEDALRMLNKRSKELEASKTQLENKNTQLTLTLQELKEVRKMLSTRGEDERKRIARELHDDTLARITDLKRYIESLINSNNLPLSEKKQLGISIQILDNVTHEIRRIINALRPSMLDNVLGLIPAIENLLDELAKRSNHKIQTKLSTSLSKLKLPELHEINLYRIIQEALNNVFKHSSATKVEISIEEQPGQILFLITDNGIGFKSNSHNKGFGLIDIKERAELIGANIQYLNKPYGSGTTLEIVIPQLVTASSVLKKSFPADLQLKK